MGKHRQPYMNIIWRWHRKRMIKTESHLETNEGPEISMEIMTSKTDDENSFLMKTEFELKTRNFEIEQLAGCNIII